MKVIQLSIALLLIGVTHSYSTKKPAISRRSVFGIPFVIAGAAPTASMALDIDAFMQKELDTGTCSESTDKKCQPKLTEDQALCRFGQPSKKTGEACLRAGMSTARPSGVDAFGKVDRGEFLRCKVKYIDDGKNYVKEWQCT